MPQGKEKKIVNAMKLALEKKAGGFWYKTHGGMMQQRGLPDLVGCVQGKSGVGLYIGIEVKHPDNKAGVTALQQNTIDQIKHAGGLAFVSTSVEDAVGQVLWHMELH
jgi:hypothetical protein